MIRSYILVAKIARSIDVDSLPVRVWLGGRSVALVTSDDLNVDLLISAGYDCNLAFDGYMTCGKRTVSVSHDGAIPVVVEEPGEDLWCLDCFLDECKVPQHCC